MPPCSDTQQDTAADVVITLGAWVRQHPDFVLGANEAGIRLAGATRAADAALFRRTAVGAQKGRLRDVAPVLAVEVAGVEEPEGQLRDKAAWYLSVGVATVWLVLPDERIVEVLTPSGTTRHAMGERIAPHPALPGLTPLVDELFVQISDTR